jgi:hypothetical protein
MSYVSFYGERFNDGTFIARICLEDGDTQVDFTELDDFTEALLDAVTQRGAA